MNSEPQSEFETSSPGYSRRLLDGMFQLWNESLFCDITLLIGKKRFQAHKTVLAAASPFFKAMFSSGMNEQNKNEIELHEVPGETFNSILSFCYTGHVKVDVDTCQDLLAIADMLGISDVVDLCSQFLLEHISPHNCVVPLVSGKGSNRAEHNDLPLKILFINVGNSGIFAFADVHNLVSLKHQAERYVENHFMQVCKGEEFMHLDLNMLLAILGSERLCIERESQVLEAGVGWLQADLPSRRKHLLQILNQVRMNLISHRHLFQIIDSCTDHGIKITLTRYASRSATMQSVNAHGLYLPVSVSNSATWPRHNAMKYIFVIGGFARTKCTFITTINTLNSVERYDVYTKKWQPFQGMQHPRSSHGLTVLDRKLVVAGGEDASLISDSVECFDPDENFWTSLPSMNHPRYGLGLVSLHGYLYAIGGHVGTEIGASIEKYDPQERTWTEIDNMPNPRFAMATVEYEGLIYIVGGLSDAYRESDAVESYNPVTREWCPLARLKYARAYHGLVAHDGHLYAVGGFNEDSGSLSSVEKYSIRDNTWTPVSGMAISRAGAGVAAVNGKIYVFGGRSEDLVWPDPGGLGQSVTLDCAEHYDPEQDRWTHLPKMAFQRCETVAVVL